MKIILLAKQIRHKLVLLVGENAISLFDFYNVDKVKNKSKKECYIEMRMGNQYINSIHANILKSKENYFIFFNYDFIMEMYHKDKLYFNENIEKFIIDSVINYMIEVNDIAYLSQSLINETNILIDDILKIIINYINRNAIDKAKYRKKIICDKMGYELNLLMKNKIKYN